ncbi:MAG: Na+-dependent transporter [Methylobacteriaceae bacterium]|nr:Na+-dependent transporter [Methylobacteriaceae bacterium]
MLGALITTILRGLAAIGRTGARGLALSLVAGLSVPALGAWLKPWLPLMVGMFVTIGFARIDFSRARDLGRRPAALAAALVWLVASLPLAIWAALGLVGRETLSPGLVLGLSLQAASAPILATPAIALLLGLEPTFALLLLTAHMAILPVVAPLIAGFVAGDAVPLDGWAIARNLALLLAGAWIAAAAIRRAFPLAAIRRRQHEIDGVNIVLLFLFAIGIFDGIAARALAEPGRVLAYVGIAFAVALTGQAAGFLALRRATSPGDAFVAGYATGNRNAGLMVAAMGGVLAPDTWLYFAAVQGPIYLAPWLVAPLARRLVPPVRSN